jgi:small subunit ribosomal protein S16
MLMIRLQRIGKKHQPAYRLVVGEKRNKLRGGKQLEDLGWFNPVSDKSEFKKERILHWMKMGAKPSDTVHNLLVNAKIVEGKKIAVHKKPKAAEGAPAAAAPAK